MDTLVPLLVAVAIPAALVGWGIAVSKLDKRKRRRQWESGKYGATGFGAGAGAEPEYDECAPGKPVISMPTYRAMFTWLAPRRDVPVTRPLHR
jgi:hypothetical protein